MNGDQSVIGWTQNIGTDARPNNEGKASQVYSDIELRCDGKIIGKTGTFSNDPSIQAQIPDHQYENGLCIVCGKKMEDFMKPDEDGYYNIANPKQLIWYASNINNGDTRAKGRLIADIDMEGMCDKFNPIGNTEETPFNAIFDGQGHRISNLVVEQETNCAGLFGYIKAPCTIQNLVLDETCSITGAAYSGLIGESIGGKSGDIHMTNLGNEGTVTTTGVHAGGIIGCCMSSSAHFIITNCYTTGTINGGGESGQLSGWVGDNAEIIGCWSTSKVTGTESNDRYFVRYGSIAKAERCYSLYGTQVAHITKDQVANGELCWLLNTNQTNIHWYQTLGEDAHPVLDSTHGVVVVDEEGKFKNTPESINIKGDVNHDGRISIVDVAALVEILQGRDNVEPYKYSHWAADVDEDGFITLADLTALRDIILER